MDHDLGHQVVVVGGHAVALPHPGVDPHPGTLRHDPVADPSRSRREIARRILGGETHLDGVTGGCGGAVGGSLDGVRQWTTCRQVELLADDVESGNELGHAMLDLQSGVDFEEPRRAVRCPQELRRGGVLETGRGRDPDRAVVQIAPFVRRQARRRRLLDELLVAPLERTVPLADGDDVARRVTEQLHLDVPGRPDDALQVDRTVAECGERLGRSGGQRGRQIGRRRDKAHAAAAATGRGLDHHREPDPPSLGDDAVDGIGPFDRRGLERPGDRVHPDRPRHASGVELVAERIDRGCGRTDEDQTGILDGPREGCPL